MFSRFALWLVCAFVVWNVTFDRYVATAAHEFTREQVIAHQQGGVVRRIDDALRPRVRNAAIGASAWGGAVLLIGGLLTHVVAKRHAQ